jgi:SAM-dependent methyltransferase
MLTKLRRSIGERVGRPRRWRILQSAPRGGVGAEIGVYRGDFTAQLLAHIPLSKLHLIDCWWTLGSESYEHEWFEGASTHEAYDQAVQVADERCQFHIGDDLEILPRFPDRYFDWVYLDTSHQYEHTIKELEILRTKVKPTGLITGDDWYPDPTHELNGVYRAVNEFCDRNGCEVVWLDEWVQWAIRPAGLGE